MERLIAVGAGEHDERVRFPGERERTRLLGGDEEIEPEEARWEQEVLLLSASAAATVELELETAAGVLGLARFGGGGGDGEERRRRMNLLRGNIVERRAVKRLVSKGICCSRGSQATMMAKVAVDRGSQ